jgi:hypothetical protein
MKTTNKPLKMTKSTVKIPGSDQYVDILKIPVHKACRALNAWDLSNEIFKDGDFKMTMHASAPAWTFARSSLLRRGKARINENGQLEPVK